MLADQIIKRGSKIFEGNNFIYAFFAILAYFSDAWAASKCHVHIVFMIEL